MGVVRFEHCVYTNLWLSDIRVLVECVIVRKKHGIRNWIMVGLIMIVIDHGCLHDWVVIRSLNLLSRYFLLGKNVVWLW